MRRWEAWQRYVTLCLLAHAFLVIRCLLDSREEEAATQASKKGIPSRILVPLTVPEVRRVLLAMAEAEEEKRVFRLGWSRWRRAHQAVSARCRRATLAAKGSLEPEGPSEDRTTTTTKPRVSTLPLEEAAPLSDEEWEVLEPLIPTKPPAGRPYHDHRTVLGGIL